MSKCQVKISFVIPTHNRARLLKECLDSIISQTYPAYEIIVVDDHSVDNTESLVKSYIAKYQNIIYLKNNSRGVSAARNAGIFSAVGDYIAFMDDDDLCLPNRLETQVETLFKTNFKYNFIVSGFNALNEKGDLIEVYDYLKPTQSIGYPQRWLIKRELLIQAGGFDESAPPVEDVELFFRLKSVANIYFNSTPVTEVRFSSISLTSDPDKMIKGVKRLIELHGQEMNDNEYNGWLQTLCIRYMNNKNWHGCLQNYKKYSRSIFNISHPFIILSIILKTNKILLLYKKVIQRVYFKIEKRRFYSV